MCFPNFFYRSQNITQPTRDSHVMCDVSQPQDKYITKDRIVQCINFPINFSTNQIWVALFFVSKIRCFSMSVLGSRSIRPSWPTSLFVTGGFTATLEMIGFKLATKKDVSSYSLKGWEVMGKCVGKLAKKWRTWMISSMFHALLSVKLGKHFSDVTPTTIHICEVKIYCKIRG